MLFVDDYTVDQIIKLPASEKTSIVFPDGFINKNLHIVQEKDGRVLLTTPEDKHRIAVFTDTSRIKKRRKIKK